MITQFQGEDRKEAIVNHFSLDIDEEDRFLKYIDQMGYSIDAEDEVIESLHRMWNQKLNP
jgi:hypothetical protein